MIYFAHAIAPVDRIKIGFSSSPNLRVQSLSHMCPVDLVLLASMRGGRVAEAQVHYLLRDHRVRHEWFNAHPEVLLFIETVTQSGDIPGLDADLVDVNEIGPADNLRDLLAAAGMSVSQAAREMGVSSSLVGNWVNFMAPGHIQPLLNLLRSRGIDARYSDLCTKRAA